MFERLQYHMVKKSSQELKYCGYSFVTIFVCISRDTAILKLQLSDVFSSFGQRPAANAVK